MRNLKVIRTNVKIEPDASRVLIRPFIPHKDRVVKIIARIAAQPDREVSEHLQKIRKDFSARHIEVESTFLSRYDSIRDLQFTDLEPSLERRLLIGSYFTSEYSLESAALFNPSIVPHPDQSNLEEGSTRFIMSLRAVGEGHVSSVAFREGVIDEKNSIKLVKPTRFVVTPNPVINKQFDKKVMAQKFMDMGFSNEYSDKVFHLLSDEFTFADLDETIRELHAREPALSHAHHRTKENLFWIAKANYDIQFDTDVPIGGRILFPNAPSEKQGIEDARFVRFTSRHGEVRYYATTTAWDGKTMLTQIIETNDFLTFKVRTLNGEAVRNKGMALFPRKIGGKYAMLSRLDNENIYLMYSDYVQFWRNSQLLMKPSYPWEFYQMGNCGSPLETEEGWLVITHGVGAMRRYAIGAALLDLEAPGIVRGRTTSPILVPNQNEREGYVPNVVYSCGGQVHGDHLIVPYAMSDYASRFAIVSLERLLGLLTD